MDRFRLNGLGRAGFRAVLANQIAVVLCALSGSALTPVFANLGAAVFMFWDWKHTAWILTLTPGKTSITSEDNRQMWISGWIFGCPLFWAAIPFSLDRLDVRHRLGADVSIEWALNLAAMAAIVCMCLGTYFKHFRI